MDARPLPGFLPGSAAVSQRGQQQVLAPVSPLTALTDAAVGQAAGSAQSLPGSAASLAALLAGLAVAPRRRGRWCLANGLRQQPEMLTGGRAQASSCRKATPGAGFEKVIGIDLGTCNSAVAAFEAGVPTILPNAEGERTTPSVVAFDKTGEMLVGTTAKRQAALNPENTFSSVKRLFGSTYDEVAPSLGKLPYKVLEEDGKVKLDCPSLREKLAPEEISAHVLRKLRDDASSYLNADIRKAVITVPAYFNDAQRQATKAAGKLAGLEVLRICNEPTMAALAYGLDQKSVSKLVVFDLGGGTFDVSVMETGGGICEVLATTGDCNLGGDDFDQCILEWLARDFEAKHGIDLKQDKQALQRLTEASEKAKVELSSLSEVRVSVPFVTADASGPLHIDEVLTREHFQELCEELFLRLREPVLGALKDARVLMKKVSEVVLAGGSCRMPAVQALVQDILPGKPQNMAINPDEVVAIGASVQAAMLAGEAKDIMLIDVTPLTLGVETDGGVFSPVMEKGTAIPWTAKRIFTTSADAQDAIEVVVLQGERPLAKHNKKLGKFRLDGIPPAPKGVPKIEVTFDVNIEGILTVSAKDWATRQEKTMTIEDASNLDDKEVQRILDKAEDSVIEDEDEKRKLELRHAAACLMAQTEQNIAELGWKCPEDVKLILEDRIKIVEVTLQGEDTDHLELQSAVDDLRFELMKLGQRIYGKQVAPDRAPGPASPRSKGGVAGGGILINKLQEDEEDEDADEDYDYVKDVEERKRRWESFLNRR